jgi:hypothetical protein
MVVPRPVGGWSLAAVNGLSEAGTLFASRSWPHRRRTSCLQPSTGKGQKEKMTETQSKNPKDHSVWLFYLLAFGWTWLFWVPVALAEQGIITLPENLPGFLAEGNPAAWGPLLASLLLTALNKGWAGIKDCSGRGSGCGLACSGMPSCSCCSRS